jgi:hypothetical protein
VVISRHQKCFGIISSNVIRHLKMLGWFPHCESETPFKTNASTSASGVKAGKWEYCLVRETEKSSEWPLCCNKSRVAIKACLFRLFGSIPSRNLWGRDSPGDRCRFEGWKIIYCCLGCACPAARIAGSVLVARWVIPAIVRDLVCLTAEREHASLLVHRKVG